MKHAVKPFQPDKQPAVSFKTQSNEDDCTWSHSCLITNSHALSSTLVCSCSGLDESCVGQ